MPSAALPRPTSTPWNEPSVSASAALAPPCSSPYGWRLPATGMVATTRSGVNSVISMPIVVASSPRISRTSDRPQPGPTGRQAQPGPAWQRVTDGDGHDGRPFGHGERQIEHGCERSSNAHAADRALSGTDPKLGRVSVTSTDAPATAARRGAGRRLRRCCCWTATRSPTGPSSPFRWRTSPPPPGSRTNAVYGFTSMLINLLRDERPTHVGVAFDLSRQTWRREEYVEYKANRSSSPASSPARSTDQGGACGAADPVDDGRELRGRRHHRHTDDASHRGRHAGAASAPAIAMRCNWSRTRSRCCTRVAVSPS